MVEWRPEGTITMKKGPQGRQRRDDDEYNAGRRDREALEDLDSHDLVVCLDFEIRDRLMRRIPAADRPMRLQLHVQL